MRLLQDITFHYGHINQLAKAAEECSELTKELCKQITKPNFKNIGCLIDEIADVEIMLNQLKIMFDCEIDVEERIEYKINRQIERMRNGE